MTINTLSDEFADAPIESIVLDDGRKIKAKKISRQAIAAMDAFIPGIRDLSTGLSVSLPIIETLSKTKLFVANGDISQYTKTIDGTLLSSVKGSNGKIVGQPGFTESNIGAKSAKAAMSIGKCIPYVQIAIAIIEIGVNVYKYRETIKAELQKYYDERAEELSDHYALLWSAMEDYTVLASDDATRAAYMSKIIDAINSANKKFDEMKKISQDPGKTNFRSIEIMKSALIVYSFAYMLKIMYSKTECKTYIENAINDIKKRTDEMNDILANKYSYDKGRFDNKINKSKRIFGAVNKNIYTKIGTAFVTFGANIAGEQVAKLHNNRLEKKLAYTDEMNEKLCMLSNPYADCIGNLGLILSDKNLILMDDEYLYYEIPETCSQFSA